MRFGEYVARNGLVVEPVNRFAGFAVEITLPGGWQPFRSVQGMWVWCQMDASSSGAFSANAVLTMHIVADALEEGEVFGMLADEQLHSVLNCRENYREVCQAEDGIGLQGLLVLEISIPDFGAICSLTQSRIVRYGEETMIAQFTATALASAPPDQADFTLRVRPGAAAKGVSVWTGDVHFD
ncbi:hypothetical protein [Mycobacterium sp. MUNTM1]